MDLNGTDCTGVVHQSVELSLEARYEPLNDGNAHVPETRVLHGA